MGRKILILSAVCIAFLTAGLKAQDARIRIAVMDLQALSGYEQGEAVQLTELLKADLINNNRFSVVDQERLDSKAAAELAGCTDIACAVQIGQLLETEYVLTGTVGMIAGNTAFSILLVNVLSEERVLAEDSVAAGDDIFSEIQVIAEKVTNSAVLITQVDLEDIRGYIRREQYEKSARYLEFYIDRTGDDSEEVRQVESVIYENLAEIRYTQASEMLNLYLFSDAKILIEEALQMSPENPVYLDLKEQIELEEAAQAELDKDQIIGEIEDFLDEKNYNAANTLMLILLNNYSESDSKVLELKNSIKSGLSAEEFYEKAKRSLDRKDFEAARNAINESIRLLPDEENYSEFVLELEAEEAEYAASRAVWEGYRQELARINPTYLFAVKKELSSFFNINVAVHSFSYREGTTLEEYEFIFPGAELSFLYHIWEPFTMPFQFSDFFVTVFGNIGFGRFSNETINRYTSQIAGSSYATVDQENIFLFDMSAGGGATIVLFAYYLGFGLEASTGLLSRSDTKEFAVFEEQREYRKTYYSLGLGFDFWLGWNASDNIELFSKLRFSYPLLLGIEHSMENRRIIQFSIGLGYSFF